MRRSLFALLGCALLAVAWLSGPAPAAESPCAGTWKVTVFENNGAEINVWLVKVEEKDGKPTAEVIAAGLPNFKGATIDAIKADGKTLTITFSANKTPFVFTGYLPKGDAKPKQLRGTIQIRSQKLFAQLERTELTELKDRDIVLDAAQAFGKVQMMKDDDKEKATALKEIIEKHAGKPVAYIAGAALVRLQVKDGAGAADVRKTADAAIKVAAEFGPDMKVLALSKIARELTATEKLATLAVVYARQAEKGLDKDTPAATSVAVLKVLVKALRKAGKADDAKDPEARMAKIDEQLDREFLKDAIPFTPDVFKNREGKSDRVVVFELFTGAECPPCVAADVAFDALLKTYKPSDVIFLQYHLHIPRPDALTNADNVKREQYYGLESTPTGFIDGKASPPLGGYKEHGKERYATLRPVLDKALETDALAQIKLTATRKGDKIDVQADVSGLKKPGENIRLRFVLVEDVVRYPGSNGQRLHHHVVRAFPGGVDGFALEKETGKQNVAIGIGELAKTLDDYLTGYAKKRKMDFDDRPLDLRRLKVVAFVQDNDSKEILQAAQVDLPEAK